MSTSLWIGIVVAFGVILVFILWLLFLQGSAIIGFRFPGTAEPPEKPKPPTVEAGPQLPSGAPPDLHVHKNVQFTIYRPATIVPKEWYKLLAFAHLSKRRIAASEDEPDPVKEVQRQAKQFLSDQPAQYEPAKLDRFFSVPREGFLLFVPVVEGCRFNPPTQSVQWLKSVQKIEFEMIASSEVDGRDVEGQMTIYLGKTLLTEVPLRITIDSQYVVPESQKGVIEATSAEPYRKIFASYSHKDTEIVEDFERYGFALGDDYLRDVRNIRTGEVWSEKLEELIRQASVFQLFWSSNSMTSEFVKQEWEYALGLNREKFIRPVYWEEPLPKREPDLPPEALSRLDFYQFKAAGQEKRGVIPPVIEQQRTRVGTDNAGFATGSTRYCTKCGAANADMTRYCLSCGTPLSQISGYQPMQSVNQRAQGSSPTSGRPLKIAALIVFVALAAAALYVGYRIIWGSPSQPPPQNHESPSPTPNATVGTGGASQFTPTIAPTPNQSPTISPSPTPTPTPRPPRGSAITVDIKTASFTNQSNSGTFRLFISNVGSDVIKQVEITERLPDDIEYVRSTPQAASRGQAIVWQVDEIPVEGSTTIRVMVKLRRRLKPGETYIQKQNTIVTYFDSLGRRHRYLPAN